MKNTFEFIGQNGGSATVEQLTGCFPAPSGKNFRDTMTDQEKWNDRREREIKQQEATEFFKSQGINLDYESDR